MDDSQLLERWRRGDRESGGQLFDRHFSLVRRFFVNKVGSDTEVEELVQRTFAAVLDAKDRYRSDSNFRTWLMAIARNILREWARERARELRRESADDPDVIPASELSRVGVSTMVELRRQQKLVLTALRELPLEDQMVLELYYWEQFSARELADVLGIPEGTARSKLRRAKLAVRGTIETLLRTHEAIGSSVADFEGWARELREVWGV